MSIAIVDYQMGNLRSVQKALEHVGASAIITDDAETIRQAAKVILPGVGAFCDAAAEIRKRSLDQTIVEAIRDGKPFLGICLGLQLLFDLSHERGEHPGLGVLTGTVDRFAASLTQEQGLKVPHMGWNQVQNKQPNCPLFAGIEDNAYFYFVHSYFVVPKDPGVQWLSCDYGGEFCAAVWKDNVFATQFHPEKSQRDGLKLLQNFAEL